MKKVVIALFFILLVAHQDFWAWEDATLVIGFMPVGLFYHAVFALASTAIGMLAIKYMWPESADSDGAADDPEKDIELSGADLDLMD